MGSAGFQRNISDLGVRGTAAHFGLDCFSFWIGVVLFGIAGKRKAPGGGKKQLGE